MWLQKNSEVWRGVESREVGPGWAFEEHVHVQACCVLKLRGLCAHVCGCVHVYGKMLACMRTGCGIWHRHALVYPSRPEWIQKIAQRATQFSMLGWRRYALPAMDMFKACGARDLTLLERHSFVYTFRTFQARLHTPAAPDLTVSLCLCMSA